MYTPSFNRIADRALLLEAMRQNSFAILFGPVPAADPEAAPVATHLPLVIRDEGPHGVLAGHFAKANPHWAALAGKQTLVVFSGPHSYVSPALYDEELSVPTWNYVAIHVWGTLQPVEGEDAKEPILKNLIAQHEPDYASRWNELPLSFRRSMLAGIVGFRIAIERIEGKFKLSQNRSAADRNRVRSAHAAGSAAQQELAAWMQRLGI